ncbi:hypothetical protein ACWT_6583 [Actinoplanes sp. SE50]|uniref:hypothetical protein n=1 Tax=unclassified Actinoplanes TaxID=2626549 RepID=UPI00023EC520|nr:MULTISPECIES: hypothetical protein [unclassified Actinoplanes]AEV87595.1 hypothetical protein ACPL_6713 [Actinoplanes sp. SE50/110]ATO85998.1 hypothetical protein ACWT_6583 [Actinoplanes sp. SE50]SLM03412.1 uncharacterized protein ACSP50_6701 [Actinoplanes sp. SE50/110]
MGSGRWSTDVWTAAENYRAATGQSAFAYSDSGARQAHPALDPRGVFMRESRDSREHPASTPIVVMFDVTGSMRHVPRVLQTKLPQLLGLLTRRGYATDPQIMFGAIGDATCDRVPLQVGQFESDNRMDEDLSRIVLEGGGGGGRRESYELAMYFLARHVVMDSMITRGRKGYLFLIGDEMPYDTVKPDEVRAVIGDELPQALPTREVLAELRRKFEVFFILPTAAGHGGDRAILAAWRDLLGQHVLELDNVDEVCETIAGAVGMCEENTGPAAPRSLAGSLRRW